MKHTAHRGSILIYAVLIMAAMLALSLALAGLFIGRLQVSRSQRNSVVAVYIADSAVEKCLYEARKNINVAVEPTFQGSPAGTFTIASASSPVVMVTANCAPMGNQAFRFRAVGIFQGVQRSVEVNQ